MFYRRTLLALSFLIASWFGHLQPRSTAVHAENPHGYLAEFSEPYYPHTNFPKLITPQWVGESGVDAVVTLAIDDMRDTAKYETYLRPILERLKTLQQTAPVSIMTCSVDPADPQLQRWIKEGLSIEVHTVDHPCPCLQGNQFDTAKSTYDRCVDLMASIKGNQPVAFRTPCCDSRNTPSPRLWSEIFNQRTPGGNFLQADSSVFNVFTNGDPELPKQLVLDPDGSSKMKKYIPFPSFVNTIENYPYPYVIGKLCWQFPCMVPSDWEAQNLHQPNNPVTVADMKSALDATVIKKGMFNLVFHPHGWLRNDQVIELIDYAHAKYGKRVKFLTFKDCIDRINHNLLLDQPLRSTADGGDNGVRIVDVDNNGFLDVLIGNEQTRTLRVWQSGHQEWNDVKHEIQFTSGDAQHRLDHGIQIGQFTPQSTLSLLANHEKDQAIYEFADGNLRRSPLPKSLLDVSTSVDGVDNGVRLRDIDSDGFSEIIVANDEAQTILRNDRNGDWVAASSFPAPIVDADGRDNGVRFVDLDGDGHEDVIVSNGNASGVHLFDTDTRSFSRVVENPAAIPMIVREGTNNGVWFSKNHMWVQNESTNRLPDGVDRRSFNQLLGDTEPGPRSPDRSLGSMQLQDGFEIELVAAEPLVMDPVAIDWGPDGKLWVVEMADYPLGMDDQGEPGGRVRFLEDTNQDGKYDSSTLFMDKIPYPTGVMAWRDGVIISAAPSVFFAADRDQDGRAEVVQELYRGFVEGNQQHRVNGFERGLDNWIYLANGDSGGEVQSLKTGERVNLGGQDLRIRPDRGMIDLQTGRTQFGRHRDDHGNWFGCSNPLPVRHFVLADHYMRRNPFVTAPPARRDIARVDNTQLFPVSRVLSHWSGYRAPAAGSGHKFTSACSTMVYRDNLLGNDFLGDTFTCAPVHNLIHRRKLVPNGVSFESTRPDDNTDHEFLASTDSWFRPATVTTGPDGALWIVDMYRLVIEHPEWIDDQREKELFLRAGHDRGRIYRVFPSSAAPRPIVKFDTLDSSAVADLLDSSNGRVRDLAQQVLVARGDPAVTDKLEQQALQSPTPMGRLHALCTLAGIGQPKPETLITAFTDSSSTVRRHAIRLSEDHLRTENETARKILAALNKTGPQQDPLVQLQLAYSLGEAAGNLGVEILARMAVQHTDSTYLKAAIVSSLHRDNLPAFYKAIAKHPSTAEAYRPTILQMAARMDASPFLASVVNDLLDQIDKAEPSTLSMRSLNSTLAVIDRKGNALPRKLQDRIAGVINLAMKTASSIETDPSIRVAAIELAGSDGRNAQKLLKLLSITEPVEIQIATAGVVAPLQPQQVLKRFSVFSPTVRSAAVDILLLRESTSLALLAAARDGTMPLNSIGLVHRQKLTNHANKQVQAEARLLFKSGQGTSERRKIAAEYKSKVTGNGKVELGKTLYTKHCSACHRFNGNGNIVGPDLTALKNRSTEALVTAIIDPGAAVEDKYIGYSVLTIDGVVHAGIIAGESSTAIELVFADGKRKTIVRSDIERIQSSGQSLMPEGMEKNITTEEMNHLITFLNQGFGSTLQPTKNALVTVQANADGTIHLPATACQMNGEQFRFESRYGNIGFWNQPNEFVEWTVQVPESGTYDVFMDYACPDAAAGNECKLSAAGKNLKSSVTSTGSWDQYREMKLGAIQLVKGETSVQFGPAGNIQGWLLDLRSVTLRPANQDRKPR